MTRPEGERAPQGKKKHPDKEVIHGQPVEEVAMDTAGEEMLSCTEVNRKDSAGVSER